MLLNATENKDPIFLFRAESTTHKHKSNGQKHSIIFTSDPGRRMSATVVGPVEVCRQSKCSKYKYRYVFRKGVLHHRILVWCYEGLQNKWKIEYEKETYLLPHGEDGAGGHIAVNIGGSVERIKCHTVLAYDEGWDACGDREDAKRGYVHSRRYTIKSPLDRELFVNQRACAIFHSLYRKNDKQHTVKIAHTGCSKSYRPCAQGQ